MAFAVPIFSEDFGQSYSPSPIWQTFDSERSEAIVIHKADNIYQKGFAKLPLSTHLGFFLLDLRNALHSKFGILNDT